MTAVQKTVDLIDKFTTVIGRTIAWLTLAMVMLTFLIVVLRYGFNLGWIAMQESVLYLHGIVFMLGAAYTLQQDGHVRVDIFYQKFSEKKQALVNFLGGIFLLLPVCIFIFWVSLDYVLTSWQIMEKSPEAGGLPLVFISKSLILVFTICLLLQGIAEILRNLVKMIDKENDSAVIADAKAGQEKL